MPGETEQKVMHFLLFVWDKETRERCCITDDREVKTMCNLDLRKEEATLNEDEVTCEKCRGRMIDPFHRICLMI